MPMRISTAGHATAIVTTGEGNVGLIRSNPELLATRVVLVSAERGIEVNRLFEESQS